MYWPLNCIYSYKTFQWSQLYTCKIIIYAIIQFWKTTLQCRIAHFFSWSLGRVYFYKFLYLFFNCYFLPGIHSGLRGWLRIWGRWGSSSRGGTSNISCRGRGGRQQRPSGVWGSAGDRGKQGWGGRDQWRGWGWWWGRWGWQGWWRWVTFLSIG